VPLEPARRIFGHELAIECKRQFFNKARHWFFTTRRTLDFWWMNVLFLNDFYEMEKTMKFVALLGFQRLGDDDFTRRRVV
jgi:hypothetical protein